ncbi:MAG: S41 family peptidase, partial [Terriglobia bacterium]
ALHGLLESLDPYSSYLSPQEYQEYQRRNRGEASPGIVVSKRFGFVSIVTALPNGPAQKAGLESGDVIESMDGQSTREMSLAEVTARLEGPVGSTITLAVVRERAGEPKPVPLRREVVPLPDVAGRIIAPGIGYLRVEALPKGAAQKIAAQVQELKRSGASKWILDLRRNATGEMEEGVATANLFLRRGLIGYLTGQQYPRESFMADAGKAVADEPLAVIVNSATGGAAELVAAAILDNRRGDVIGERTFGIGSVQKIIPLDDGSALLLSVAKYYSPSGKQIQESGVTPSVVVEEERELVPLPEPGQAPAPSTPREDAPLKRAIEVLSQQQGQPQAA